MAKDDFSVLQRDELNKALAQVDKVVMRKYISTIDKRPVFIPSYDVAFSISEKELLARSKEKNQLPLCIVGSNIMLSKLTRVVYDKDENILDKLTTVYNATALYEDATIVMLLKSDGTQLEVYLGTVCKKTDEPDVPMKQMNSLISNMKANFPGTQLENIEDSNERRKIVQSIFSENVCVSAVSGIAALKDDEITENSKYIQGLEKLADALKGKKCAMMIIADPVEAVEREAIRSGYEELYTALKPFEKSEYSVNSSNGSSVTDSVMYGVTDTTNESIAKTKTHTITEGTNSSHTVGGSIGVNASVTATVGVKAWAVNASASATVGTSVSADYHYMHGKHKDTSEADGISETSGTSKALSEQNSIANALSTNNGEGLQITYENRSIRSILEKIDLQLERIAKCEDYGMYDCGVYFLSADYATCLSAANTYKSIMQGENSAVEASHISIWNKEEAIGLIPYLSTFSHPIFDLADVKGERSVGTASTLVSGKELSIYMGLPKKSISGIPVIECTAFGRNVLYAHTGDMRMEFELGKIHHMCEDDDTPVFLNKNSLTSHAFVTGSTGSGKSNAIYQLLYKMCFRLGEETEDTHFMVIEPAKGEYRDVFGGYENVQVLGTNPLQGKLLRINPFSFPDSIHVLEHIDRLIEIFNVCWPMYAAMPAVLKEAVERAYEAAGWNLLTSECMYEREGKKLFPNFIDVLNKVNSVINESQYSADSKGDYVGALSMRISSLTNGINGQVLTANELTSQELFDSNIIVDLSRVGSSETKALLMGLLVVKLQEYRMATAKGSNKQLHHVTVLEEAHNLLKRTSTEQSAESANLAGKSVEMLANAIAEMRTYGEGFIIVDQSPGLMDMSVIRNTNTKIILRLPDAGDRELVGKAANLTDDQIVELARLRTGVCAVYQNNWIEPVLCHVEQWKESHNKKDNAAKDVVFDTVETKRQIVRLALKTPYELRKEDVEHLIEEIDKTRLSTEMKIKLMKLAAEKDVEKFRSLRKSIIYEVFAPDAVMEKNICYRNEMKEWCLAMGEALIPHLDGFSEDEANKILALLAYEKNRLDGRREYGELVNNLLAFIDKGGRS